MKKFNIFLVCILVLILGGAGYMIYEDSKEPTFNGGGGSGTGGGGTIQNSNTNNNISNNQPEIPAREKLKLISSADASQYEEIMAFDFFNKDNCKSYEDWAFVNQGTSSVYGSSYPFTTYYAKINGYHVILLLNGNTATTEDEFFATDWENYNFESSPKSNSLFVFDYNLENTFSILYMGESYYHNDLLPGEVDISVTNASTFLESKGVILDKTIGIDVNFNTLQYFENVMCPVFKLSYLHELTSLEVDGITYNEFINFHLHSLNYNISFENYECLGAADYENATYVVYTATINEYKIYFSLVGSSGDFLHYLTWSFSNYDFVGNTWSDILIVDPDNTLSGKYYQNSVGEIVSLEDNSCKGSTAGSAFSSITEILDIESTCYKLDLYDFNVLIFDSEESSTLSLRNAQQEEPSTTCSQVGNYEVCDEYEEDDYGYEWGPMHWPEEE